MTRPEELPPDRVEEPIAMTTTTRSAASGADRRSFADKAYVELKRRILGNEMPSGHQMTEVELADLLEMSRTPTREAMIRLAKEGLVEIRPRHGMRVLPVSVADMEEIYAVLTALESEAAGLAAARGLSDDELGAMRAAVQRMDQALRKGDLRAWADADGQFHQLLVEASGNRRFVALVQQQLDQSHRVRVMTIGLRPRPTKSNEDHKAVIEAIARRQPALARRVHRRHREQAGRLLVSILRQHGITQL